jgi:hypothetical protein
MYILLKPEKKGRICSRQEKRQANQAGQRQT